ncbi:MAG: ABC transporter permease [Parvibaculaceae bacterium]
MTAEQLTSLDDADSGRDRAARLWRGRYLLPAIGGAIVLGWILVAVLSPFIAPYPYNAVDLDQRLQPPSFTHLLGTDELGRDVASRLLVGSRLSLAAGLVVVLLGASIGTLYGSIAAFVGNRFEEAAMRVTDLFFAFPPLILAMSITAALGVGVANTMLAMTVVWWPRYARLSRSLVLSQRSLEYVEAARVIGCDGRTTLFRHIMPNILGPLIVLLTMDVGSAIIVFAGLSFLGLGAVPPTPEWGAMVSSGRMLLEQWWVSAFPGFAIFSVVVGCNFLGDGLRDLLDPKGRVG